MASESEIVTKTPFSTNGAFIALALAYAAGVATCLYVQDNPTLCRDVTTPSTQTIPAPAVFTLTGTPR